MRDDVLAKTQIPAAVLSARLRKRDERGIRIPGRNRGKTGIGKPDQGSASAVDSGRNSRPAGGLGGFAMAGIHAVRLEPHGTGRHCSRRSVVGDGWNAGRSLSSPTRHASGSSDCTAVRVSSQRKSRGNNAPAWRGNDCQQISIAPPSAHAAGAPVRAPATAAAPWLRFGGSARE